MKSAIIFLATIVSLFSVQAQNGSGATLKANYASVNGMKMYYVRAGAGTPIVLLHGAFSTIDKDFGK